MNIQAITERNRERVTALIEREWYTTEMILRGKVIDMTAVDGLFVEDDGEIIALITYLFYDEVMEITSLDSFREKQGLGTQLLNGAVETARQHGCRKIVLITTNDNIHAIRFYQKRGFDMARLYRNALDVSRRMKPEIPLIGEDGIPLRHEIEFEMLLETPQHGRMS